MVFKLDIIPATFGDCLLLHVGPNKNNLSRLLIDGGPNGTAELLIPHLDKLGGAQPLPIEMAMVSHIDADHIAGMIQLFEAMRDARTNNEKPPAEIDLLWHNDFDVLVGEKRGEARKRLKKPGGGAAALQSLNEGGSFLSDFLGDEDRHDMAAVLASYAQGDKLASLAGALGMTVNTDACMLTTPRSEEALGDATITIIGPDEANINKLREGWRKFRDRPDATGKAALAAALSMDGSVSNLSSIVAVVEYQGKKLVLTGDARGDHIIDSLGETDLFDADGRMPVDVFKLPHHGSIRNIDEDTVKRFPARHYVACGDGTHGNPDRETLELIDQHAPRPFSFYMPYSPEHVDATHRAWKRSKGKPWKTATDAISDLIEKWEGEDDVTVVTGDGETVLSVSVR